ncbi:MAG: class II glutamine amidotransferase [Myxococcales bacterium]|nr:class II glutamine amidotransferase [Myxococcales bacterium]
MANRTDRLGDALGEERDAIAIHPGDAEDTGPAGYGLGFYQGGEVLHKKRPLLESVELDWGQVARDVRTDCAVFHLRRGTVGSFRIQNTHPFRMRSWLFAHNGTVDKFDAIQPRILEQIPDFIQRNIRGETDSEHLFHLILSFLHDAGQLDLPDVDEGLVLTSIRSAVHMMDRLSQEVNAPPPTLNCLLTNGRHMFAVRRGQPMVLVERRDPEGDPSLAFRYVMIVGGVETPPAGYRIVENHCVAIVDRNLNVTFQPL